MRETVPATGRKIESRAAAGVVTLTSENTLSDVTVESGTTLEAANGVAFRTTRPVVVPKASFRTGPSTIRVPVEAVEDGPEGNVPSASITVVPGHLVDALVSATNEDPTEGGDRRELPIVTDQDYAGAVERIVGSVGTELEAALDDLRATAVGFAVVAETARIEELAIAPAAGSVVGREATSFPLTAHATGHATAVDERALELFAIARLREAVRPDHELLEESLDTVVRLVGTDGEAVRYELEAHGHQRPTTIETVGPIRLAVLAEQPVQDAAEPLVPAEAVEIPLRVRDRFAATGTAISESKATGSARLHSENTLHDLMIPEGTVLATASGTEFVTVGPAVLPRASFRAGPTEIDVPVEATIGGGEGNVGPGEITEIGEDLAAALVSVTNPGSTAGGSRTETRVVSEHDYEAARRQLGVHLEAKLAAALDARTSRSRGLAIHPGTMRRTEPVLEPDPAAIVGQALENFALTMTSTATVTGVDEASLTEIGLARLRESLLPGRELLEGSAVSRVIAREARGTAVAYTIEARGRQRSGPTEPVGPVRLSVIAEPVVPAASAEPDVADPEIGYPEVGDPQFDRPEAGSDDAPIAVMEPAAEGEHEPRHVRLVTVVAASLLVAITTAGAAVVLNLPLPQ